MDKTVIYAAVILILAFLALNVLESMVGYEPIEGICLTPLDCEDLSHAECEGEWACVDNSCAWECGTGGDDLDEGIRGNESSP